MSAKPALHGIFKALVLDESNTVSSKFFLEFLERSGIYQSDPRIAQSIRQLQALDGIENDVPLSLEQFDKVVSGEGELLVHKAVLRRLRVPDFETLKRTIEEVYEEVLPDESGENASYIPQLADVDPNQFAISVTTVDGQQFAIGDADTQFSIQSCSKPVSYLLALKEFGLEYVHKHVCTEPSGRAFNDMCLKDTEDGDRKIPHNPCINAGAIMAVSMVYPDYTRSKRLSMVLDVWKALSGGPDAPIGYDNATYKSESSTASGNWCLGYMMKKYNAFPPCFSDLGETLELYFQICSILSTCRAMSVMASTLANGGLNPITGEKVFLPEDVRNALPIMMMAGMYDYSGQWAFDIGVPAKSGVGGCVYVVIPNVCGFSIWSPRLDAVGNSARGVAVCKSLVKRLKFHIFEVFSGINRTKLDMSLDRYVDTTKQISDTLFAAARGDVQALSLIHESGSDLFSADYDGRTSLHLAATEGHVNVVRYLMSILPLGAEGDAIVQLRDRWGKTAFIDATRTENVNVAALLRARSGDDESSVSLTDFKSIVSCSDKTGNIEESAPILIAAAAAGDIDILIKYVAEGESLLQCDYDMRTALHLAASNGHTKAVQYLCVHNAETTGATDRWGCTPLDDAKREGHEECAAIILKFTAQTNV
jgi:glutaminase